MTSDNNYTKDRRTSSDPAASSSRRGDSAMLKRTWSIRRPQTFSLTRRVDPGAALQREKGMIRCQVTLLDENVFTCDVDVSLVNTIGGS